MAALRSGILVCLMIAVPLTLLAALVDSDASGLNALFFFGAMFGFVIGSGCAAWIQQRGTPLSHAMVAAIVAYVGAQVVFIAIRLVAGEPVDWLGVFFTLSLVMLAGLFGGLLGSVLQSRGLAPSGRRNPS
jgi:hypothetical protein